jgi:hypothetical protein
LDDLLRQRSKFFAERVDGIFRSLSGNHVTNIPEGFGKRMITEGVLSYSSISSSKAGVINDLRCVAAKFMGRGEPKSNASDTLLREMFKSTGQWISIDGGSLRIRVYKKGTAHVEIHPEMAWRLNLVLASLYPLAIPSQFRSKPKKLIKEFQMMGRPLPFATLEVLGAALHDAGRSRFDITALQVRLRHEDRGNKTAFSEACTILEALGGVCNDDLNAFVFDYPPLEVLRDLVISGCLPDATAHQYYPTQAKMARLAAEAAEIEEGHEVLEPSAGQGGIAAFLPKRQTTCVEISSLHCAVLAAKGFTAIEADFLAWATTAPKFDRIVMNPPFSEGRALAHTVAASALLKARGRLVAILPASMSGKTLLGAGYTHEWSSSYEREFSGTGVAVVFLTARKL